MLRVAVAGVRNDDSRPSSYSVSSSTLLLLPSPPTRSAITMVAKCPSDNTEQINQSTFWDSGSKHWDAHRIGWSVAGGCALLVRKKDPWVGEMCLLTLCRPSSLLQSTSLAMLGQSCTLDGLFRLI